MFIYVLWLFSLKMLIDGEVFGKVLAPLTTQTRAIVRKLEKLNYRSAQSSFGIKCNITCINEDTLPNYTEIYIYIYVYIYIYIYIYVWIKILQSIQISLRTFIYIHIYKYLYICIWPGMANKEIQEWSASGLSSSIVTLQSLCALTPAIRWHIALHYHY